MKKLILFSTILFLFSNNIFSQQLVDYSFEHDGRDRMYSVYVPSSYDGTKIFPVVLNLHGAGSTGTEQMNYTKFNNIADTEGVLVIYPQALVGTTSWGTTKTYWNAYFGTGVNDFDFLDQILDKLEADYKVDTRRVYSMGMSNGGFMSYRLACEMSDRIAAIASVTGNMSKFQFPICEPNRAISVLQIHGTKDAVVPWNGGDGFNKPIVETVNWWAVNNQCDETAIEAELPNISTTDNSTVTKFVYENGQSNTEVQLYRVNEGGHTWPGAIPLSYLGNTNQDFDASVEIWNFFSRFSHPNPRTPVASEDVNVLAKKISVSPNPFDERILLEITNIKVANIRLIDLAGKLVRNFNINNNLKLLKINTSELQSGIYFLVVEEVDGTRFTRKIVKK